MFLQLDWLVVRYGLYVSLILASFSKSPVYPGTYPTNSTMVPENQPRSLNIIANKQYKLPLPPLSFQSYFLSLLSVPHLFSYFPTSLFTLSPTRYFWSFSVIFDHFILPIFFHDHDIHFSSLCHTFTVCDSNIHLRCLDLTGTHSMGRSGKLTSTHISARYPSHFQSVSRSINLVLFISTAID